MTLTAQAERETDEMFVDKVLRSIKDGISVEHLPTLQEFEGSFLSKRASPVQIKFDAESEAVILMGIGLPGREELILQRIPVLDHNNKQIDTELTTTNAIHYDTVISYTIASWADYRANDEAVSSFPQQIIAGLGSYFNVPAHKDHIVAVRMATPGLDDEDLYRIAMHALQNQGAAGQSHSMRPGPSMGLAY